jgi:hypothetical protein
VGAVVDGDLPYFARSNITLTPDESVELHIVGRTEHHRRLWQLDAVMERNGKRRVQHLLNGERCFRTTGMPLGGFIEEVEWTWYDGDDADFKRPPWLDEAGSTGV